MSRHPSAPAARRAFTLVEIMVALAVLLLIVVFISQLTNNASRTVVSSGKQIDADTQARVIFNRLAMDFSRMPKRADLDYALKCPADPQPGNDRFAFYSEAYGYFPPDNRPAAAEKSPLSLVAYQIADDPLLGAPTPVLRRLAKGLRRAPAAADAPVYLPVKLLDQWNNLFTDSADYKTIGAQVFRLEYAYLLKPTASAPARLSVTPWRAPRVTADGFRDVAALVVTLAILDHASRQIVTNYTALTAALPDAVEDVNLTDTQNTKTLANTWGEIIKAPDFAAVAQIPKPAAAAVRVYERYFYLEDTP
ncbi:MAG: prepilin-type N-terminal cleavage/methylation domain-containing protein [Verrucomicrobiales bacterium]|jgi:prepilin-type N-terminal cleavage/methylation domain-containing protein|nr:prepilin-type N-terminal cleavage/methylation domain-containing protein [Verrucomicrobiales bacterium]